MDGLFFFRYFIDACVIEESKAWEHEVLSGTCAVRFR